MSGSVKPSFASVIADLLVHSLQAISIRGCSRLKLIATHSRNMTFIAELAQARRTRRIICRIRGFKVPWWPDRGHPGAEILHRFSLACDRVLSSPT